MKIDIPADAVDLLEMGNVIITVKGKLYRIEPVEEWRDEFVDDQEEIEMPKKHEPLTADELRWRRKVATTINELRREK